MKPLLGVKHSFLRTMVVLILTTFAAGPHGQSLDVAPTALTVADYPGEARLIHKNGRWYVDLDMLARILDGELSRQDAHIILRVRHLQPKPANAAAVVDSNIPAAESSSFSPEFVNAGIETLFSMRSWATTVSEMISNGMPIELSTSEHQNQAAKNLAHLNASSKSDADRGALQLINNEFNHLQSWSDHLLEAKRTLRTGHYATSPDALASDDQSRRIVRCWQFLGPMLASGRFHDDGSCK